MGITPFEPQGILGGYGQQVMQSLAPVVQAPDPFAQPAAFENSFTAAPQAQQGFVNNFTSGGYGQDAFSNQYTVDPFAGQQQAVSQGFTNPAGGQVSQVGGQWAALDAHNAEIAQAANTYGVPANLLKSMINRESSGNWERDNRVYTGLRNQRMLPFVGIFESTAQSWGLNFDQMVGNKQAQVEGMAKILNGLASQYGGYENAAKVYFGGEQALNGGFTDEYGMDSNTYGQKAIDDWKYLDQASGYSGGYDQGVGTRDPQGNNIVGKAMEFVGVPYIWGSLPQAGDDPWKTGWDCSAFVNWLDDKYGVNEIPAGSHYQYQDTINKGLLVSDPNQLQAGDLVFWDTGNTAGGGAELNRAGHVGMYIGDGKFIQAANAGAGTIVSNLADYNAIYPFLGGRKMSWSGGGPGVQTQPTGGRFSNVLQKYLMRG